MSYESKFYRVQTILTCTLISRWSRSVRRVMIKFVGCNMEGHHHIQVATVIDLYSTLLARDKCRQAPTFYESEREREKGEIIMRRNSGMLQRKPQQTQAPSRPQQQIQSQQQVIHHLVDSVSQSLRVQPSSLGSAILIVR